MEDFYIQIKDNYSGVTLESIDKNDSLIKGTATHIDTVINIVQTISESINTKLSKSESKKPSSITLEFGINFAAEAGLSFITKGSIGANFKVSLTWTDREK